MNKIRLGIIGMGNIGKYHADYLLNKKISRCELVAVCDAVTAPLEKYQPLKIFGDGGQLIQSGEVDAVIIATPHFQHTTLGIAALKAGVHVMVEKPISSHKADAERLIAAHQEISKNDFRRHVPAPHRAALLENPEAHQGGLGRDRARQLDQHRLVSHRGLLRERRLARDLEGRRRRRAAQPMPAQSRHAAMALRDARRACAASASSDASIKSKSRTT